MKNSQVNIRSECVLWGCLFVFTPLAPLFLYSTPVFAEEESRLYSTREEKREAGVKHEITPWLILTSLAEIEGEWKRFGLENTDESDIQRNNSGTLQLGFDVLPFEWAKVELLTEYDTDTNDWILDEATIALEKDSLELVTGLQALDFGVYYSHFATGPILEFGETIDYGVTVAYNHEDVFDITASLYRGDARHVNSKDSLDWMVAIEAWPVDYFSFGFSIISDLADSEARFLDDTGNRYERKVPAMSGYLLWVAEQYEVSLEALGALRSFSELDGDRDQPVAWNLEFVHFISPVIDWSLRIEGSYEVEDEPGYQFGLALNYRLHENIVLTTEALYGLYRDDLATDVNHRNYDSVTTFGGLISIAF